MQHTYEKKRFWVLVAIVSISGFSQGMLLPLISVIFERDGVSSSLNGLNATGLYIGTLIISPFIEKPLRKFGYKPIILVGGGLVLLSLALFPLWKSLLFWFILRLLIGIGDNMLHFASQTWITSTARPDELGKKIAIYGMSFGVGFAVGPLLVSLVDIAESLPFIVSTLCCLIAWALVFTVKNDRPTPIDVTSDHTNAWQRYKLTLKYAWVAFLPPLVYGFLESSLNAIFPVYALRQQFDVSIVTWILSAFSIGAISTQVPLGTLGDRIGRHKVVTFGLLGGAVMFMFATFVEFNEWLVLIAFLCAGMCCGSMYSLGISFMADLTPKDLLPTGNLICSIFFSIGSLSGPFLGGAFVEHVDMSYLTLVSLLLFVIFIVVGVKRTRPLAS
ncbi:MFS transporter [Kurthia massiliensis]|uniref:MFS transporter n=1 Tax=Kurthia massiliensis TaxID=1033739 RepID=UPI000289CB74|nr:MFS transporter [Kurthia massiliensis]